MISALLICVAAATVPEGLYERSEFADGMIRIAPEEKVSYRRFEAEKLALVQAEALHGTECLEGDWEVARNDWAGQGGSLRLVCDPSKKASLSLRFNGTAITAYGMRNRYNGQIAWSLDDGLRSGVIDEYTEFGHLFQDEILRIDGLAKGPHELTITSLQQGYRKHSAWWHNWQIWFDYFLVDGHVADERLAQLQGTGWSLIQGTNFSGGSAVKLSQGAVLKGWFLGDEFHVDAYSTLHQGALRCTIDGVSHRIETASDSDKKPIVLGITGLDRGKHDLGMTHAFQLESLDGDCVIDTIRVGRREASEGSFTVDVPEYPQGRKLGVVIQERFVYEGTSITCQALGPNNDVLKQGDDWCLDLGGLPAGAVRKIRFVLRADNLFRSPELEAFRLLSAPASEQRPNAGVLVGYDCGTLKEVREALRHDLGNFCWLPKPGMFPIDHWSRHHKVDTFINAARLNEAGVSIMVSQRRGLGDFERPVEVLHNWAQDTTPDIYSDQEIEALKTLGGKRLLGLFMEEMDISMVQGALRTETMKEIPHLYDFNDRHGGRMAYQNEIARYVKRYHERGCRALVNCGVTYQFASYRAGADMVFAELQEHMVSNPVQLAYLRGASHQFNRPFGAWISLWYYLALPTDDPDLLEWMSTAKPSGPDTGYTPDEMLRSMYSAYHSGAACVVPQDSIPLFTDPDRDGEWELSRWGKALKSFYAYTKKTPPGSPVCPVAVMIHPDSGSAPTNLWQGWPSWSGDMWSGNDIANVWGKLAPERCDVMQREILKLVYPGYDMNGKQKYPGTFTDTPIGPVDVVASDISIDRLRSYEGIVLAGYFEVDDAFIEKLTAYTTGGGQLFANAHQLGGFAEQFQQRDGVVIDDSDWGLTDGPLESITLLPSTARSVRDFIGRLNRDVIRVAGVPRLEYLPLEFDSGPGVLLTNHGKEPLTTTLQWPGAISAEAMETISSTSLPVERCGAYLKVPHITVPPCGVALIRLGQ